jgi:hypothetical protein
MPTFSFHLKISGRLQITLSWQADPMGLRGLRASRTPHRGDCLDFVNWLEEPEFPKSRTNDMNNFQSN